MIYLMLLKITYKFGRIWKERVNVITKHIITRGYCKTVERTMIFALSIRDVAAMLYFTQSSMTQF